MIRHQFPKLVTVQNIINCLNKDLISVLNISFPGKREFIYKYTGIVTDDISSTLFCRLTQTLASCYAINPKQNV